jgi:hypothetical protein
MVGKPTTFTRGTETRAWPTGGDDVNKTFQRCCIKGTHIIKHRDVGVFLLQEFPSILILFDIRYWGDNTPKAVCYATNTGKQVEST